MPQIPLYNQGAGATQNLATGQLSPRANTAAFTAPALAQARMSENISGIAKIAGDFELANQKIKANTLDTEIISSIDNEFFELEKEQIIDQVEFNQKSEKIRGRQLAKIESNTGINSNLKSALINSTNARFTQQSINGKTQTHNRMIGKQAENAIIALDSISSQIRAGGDRDNLTAEARTIFDNLNETGASNNVDKTFAEWDAGVDFEVFSIEASNANNVKNLQEESESISKNPELTNKVKKQYIAVIDSKIADLRNEAFETALVTALSTDINSSQLEIIEQQILNGEIVTLPDEDILNLTNVNPSQLPTLVATLNNRANDVFNENQTAANFRLSNTDNVLQEMQLMARTSSLTKEQQTDTNLDFISSRISKLSSTLDINPKAVSTRQVNEIFAEAINILNTSIGGQVPYSQMGGTAQDKSDKILKQIGNFREKQRTSITNTQEIGSYLKNLLDGNAITTASLFTSEQKRIAVEQALTGRPIEDQLNILNINNEKYSTFTQALSNGFILGSDATNQENLEIIEQGLALFQAMKNKGGTVLGNHIINQDAEAYYESLLDLTEIYTLENSVGIVRNAKDNFDSTVSNKKIEAEVDKFAKANASKEYSKYIPFNDPKFTITNLSQVQNTVKDYAKTLTKYGVEPDKALTMALDAYDRNHMRIRNHMVRRTRGMPDSETMNELAETAIDQVLLNNSKLADEFEPDDLTIIPRNADSPTNWMVVSNGSVPVFSDDKMVSFDLGESYNEDTVIFGNQDIAEIAGIALAGTFPKDSLFGMLQTQNKNKQDKLIAQATATGQINIEYESLTGRFEGLSAREANLLRNKLLLELNPNSITAKIENAGQATGKFVRDFFKANFTSDNDILNALATPENHVKAFKLISEGALKTGPAMVAFINDIGKKVEEGKAAERERLRAKGF